MYVRFVLLRQNSITGQRDWIFDAAYEGTRDPHTPAYLAEALSEILVWFEANLKTPDRFNRSGSKGFYRRATKGIAWLKATSRTHMTYARELCALLRETGLETEMIRTDRPGYIVYEDEHQIVAEAFKGAGG